MLNRGIVWCESGDSVAETRIARHPALMDKSEISGNDNRRIHVVELKYSLYCALNALLTRYYSGWDVERPLAPFARGARTRDWRDGDENLDFQRAVAD